MSPNSWLAKACEIALTSPTPHRHAAVLVKHGRELAASTPKHTGSPSLSENSWRASSLHAEIAVLLAAGTNAKDSTLYVARVNRAGEPLLSRPCRRCESWIMRAGVRRVVYT